MRDEIILAVVAVATYFGYYSISPAIRGWVYYAMTGALHVACGLVLRRRAQHWAGLVAAGLMVSDGAQQALCGAATIGRDTQGADVCRVLLGTDLYTALASAIGAALVLALWQTRPAAK